MPINKILLWRKSLGSWRCPSRRDCQWLAMIVVAVALAVHTPWLTGGCPRQASPVLGIALIVLGIALGVVSLIPFRKFSAWWDK